MNVLVNSIKNLQQWKIFVQNVHQFYMVIRTVNIILKKIDVKNGNGMENQVNILKND
jgi:hypothetical protein